MSLLVDMMTNSQDMAYLDAADRRRAAVGADCLGAWEAGTAPPRAAATSRRRLGGAALLVVLGLVTGTAAAQVRGRDAAGAGLRDQLVADVRQRTRDSDVLAAQVQSLRARVNADRDAALGADEAGRAAAARLRAHELAVGSVAVRGPGVVVVLADAARPRAAGQTGRGGQTGPERVSDRDLQDLVNALWAVGAEAITVNDLRLTAQTAIRTAGEAILVDFRPLSPPYTVRAIGDPGRLEADVVDSPAGRRLGTFSSVYGLGFSVESEGDLRLPGARTSQVRLARPAGAS